MPPGGTCRRGRLLPRLVRELLEEPGLEPQVVGVVDRPVPVVVEIAVEVGGSGAGQERGFELQVIEVVDDLVAVDVAEQAMERGGEVGPAQCSAGDLGRVDGDGVDAVVEAAGGIDGSGVRLVEGQDVGQSAIGGGWGGQSG